MTTTAPTTASLLVDVSGPGGDETNTLNITVVLNWFEELKQRVPTGGR